MVHWVIFISFYTLLQYWCKKLKKEHLIPNDTLLADFGSFLSMTQKLTSLQQPATTGIIHDSMAEQQ